MEIWDLNSERVDLEVFCESRIMELNPGIGELCVADEIDKVLSEVKHQLKNKIISFREKEIPPNFEFDDYMPNILRCCRSNNSNNDWLTMDNIENRMLPSSIITTGYLIKETKDCLYIAMSIFKDQEEMCPTFCIVKSCITKRKVLKKIEF